VEQWRRETIEAEQAAAGGFPDPATAPEDVALENVAPEDVGPDVAPEDFTAAATSAPDAEPDEAVADEPLEEHPLPTRVPGSNLSHTPVPADGEPVDETDPMRPYRIHELLTRHSQGVHRGHTQHPLDEGTAPGDPGRSFVAEPEDLR
jgi:hypothetical protein